MTDSPSAHLRIGFLSPHNPYDRRAFSGTVFYAAEALRTHARVTLSVLGDHRAPRFADRFLRRPSRKLTSVDPTELEGLDAVVSIVGSKLVDGLGRANQRGDYGPLVHVTDATPRFLREEYGWGIPAEIEAREARVIAAADQVIYSSREMAARAAREFSATASAVPFGINFDATLLPKTCPEKPVLYQPQLLFVGNDWIRKGGEIAVAALQILRAQGIDAHLTIVGRLPEAFADTPHITSMGYLDKNKPADAATLARLYARSHLLLVPSRADCTPMVAAEAMAHGTPVLASETGGVGTLIGGSGNGSLLPLSANGTDWAKAIRALTQDHGAYHMMSDAAFDHAHTRLTWTAWSADIVQTIDALRQGAADANQAQIRVVAA